MTGQPHGQRHEADSFRQPADTEGVAQGATVDIDADQPQRDAPRWWSPVRSARAQWPHNKLDGISAPHSTGVAEGASGMFVDIRHIVALKQVSTQAPQVWRQVPAV